MSFENLILGLNDFDISDPLLAQVLVQSQAEYLESLKQQQRKNSDINPMNNESSSSSSSSTTANNILNDEQQQHLISLPSTSSNVKNQQHLL
mgnify:CR=1 FL=1